MTRRPVWLLLGVAVAAVVLIIVFLPGGSSTSANQNGNAESGAILVDPSNSNEPGVNTSGVTNPPEPQPAIDLPNAVAGQKPIQFVVVSFDGGVESKDGLMTHYMDLAKQVDGRFSFFVSGVYLLPDNKMKLNYDPPGHTRGTSAIGFGDPAIIGTRIDKLGEAYLAGNEIGTHYNGHFCGAGGVGSWSTADWTSEINQFNKIMDNWRAYNPQAADAGPLPFSSSVVKGGRTPCLEGNRPAMYKAFKRAGYEYDTSNPGKLEWPTKTKGLWDIPLQAIKVPNLTYPTLSMDYNFLFNQNAGKTTAPEAKCKSIEEDTYQAYRKALDDVEAGNRAPLILGNHMNEWVCGAYKNALTRFVQDTHRDHPDVKFISTIDLARWMDAQDPAVLKALQQLPAQAQ